MTDSKPPLWRASVIAAIYLALLMIATHVPLPDSAQNVLYYVDKPLHLLAYLILAYVLASIPVGRFSWRLGGVAMGCLLIAVVDEFTQGIVPSRNSDRLDFVADCCGIALGLAIASFQERIRRAKQSPEDFAQSR